MSSLQPPWLVLGYVPAVRAMKLRGYVLTVCCKFCGGTCPALGWALERRR